ncbi:hypothetical protein GCM10007977_071450 [Dactylosporangium sucinum]|uniref:Uncharacterized protein n=1 Tax=Dactylosporangium sucinum TaxID=1424081 RepID=A0A917U5F0_9ACTN|nr:hypothetical protein GCM10007977_071450 [Dactylosporangium sucinum]
MLNGANLPLALCFAVLEVVLPVVLTGAWPAVLVVALQVPLVAALAGRSRRAVFAWSGVLLAASYAGFWASPSAGVVAAWAVLYTLGEILYAGSGTALVTAAPSRPGSGPSSLGGSCRPGSPTPSRRCSCCGCSTPGPVHCGSRLWWPPWPAARSPGAGARATRRSAGLLRRAAR